MTEYRDFDRAVARWLDDGSDVTPPEVINAVLLAVSSTPQERDIGLPWRTPPVTMNLRLAAAVAIVSVVGLAAFYALGFGPNVGTGPTPGPAVLTTPAPSLAAVDVPAGQMTVIRQVVDAVNSRDVASLRSTIAADGVLEFPAVDARAGLEGKVFMADWSMDVKGFPEAWIGDLERWGLEAQIGSCRRRSESSVGCAVLTRWLVLQMEIGEDWIFDFDGARVTRLHMARVDPDPPEREQPLGLVDLDRWETWLRETHPDQANRLLPTEPDIFGHFYFRFGLDASPDEIGASIREYVGSRP